MTAAAVRIGLDIGGTKIAGIALDAGGEPIADVRLPTGWGGDAVIAGILDAVSRLRSRLPQRAVRSIGVGIPGVIDAARGRVLHAVNLGVESLEISRVVQDATGIRCFVENDVKAAALGAAASRPRTAPMAYLNLGTGVAAGIVVDGRIWRGARGGAGEVGHIAVDPQGRICGCGQRGCIETLCGGGALARAWGRDGEHPVKDILDAADEGDARASALRRDLFRGAAAAVRVLVLTADVETVVIGGGLVALADRLAPGIRQELVDESASSPFLRSLRLDERIEMLPAGSPVAAIGAALLGSASAESVLDKETSVHG